MRTYTILTIVAIAATFGTISVMIGTALSVQEVNAAACNAHYDADTGEYKSKCSSQKSFENSNGYNSLFHCKGC
ncbi:hypothetical protein NMY3_01121 [Candidatus Nitrosocosmicus oleophilus]|jgi:hypothetical protein|uniref:Uncharacterized protein n=1 Tax=Candidatus Nitrosocosmicus oleophilus TaxID=1353260 RepID=A0A654LY40_9ARCH|nr:hypothetical protein [Candidatus Nitrosocosmicus oleophilus]ALI35326.1 hypothetical protein NMY3_01121 [Candidatus Nitrosocosmicus oleophilus]